MASKAYNQEKQDEARDCELRLAIARGATDKDLDAIIDRYAPVKSEER
jgi:hypothetical protein